MKLNFPTALVLATIVAAPAVAAPVVTVEGFVGVGDVPETGVFTATIEVTDDAGAVLLATSEPSLELLEGRFALTLDLAGAAATLVSGETVTISVDLGEGLTGAVHLGPVFHGGVADVAGRAVTATRADALGDIPEADLVPDATVAVPFAFVNLSALPPGIDDGVDNGTIDTLTGLAIAGGVLDVAAGGVSDLVANSLTGAQIADGTITSTQLGALSADRLAAATLTGANFATASFAVADVKGVRSVFKREAGCDRPFELAVGNACARRACTIGGVDCTANVCRVPCGGGSCQDLGASPSPVTLLCFFNSGDLLGRVIEDP